MFMVSIGTFDWSSVTGLDKLPRADAFVMIVTVGTVVATHDLSKGVLAGVLLSALFFAWKIARIQVSPYLQNGIKTYRITGQLFFGTVSYFQKAFTYMDYPDAVIIDLSASHVWDQSAVNAIGKVIVKYKQLGKTVQIEGLNEESKLLIEKMGMSMLQGH